jgi:hypothetical protein
MITDALFCNEARLLWIIDSTGCSMYNKSLNDTRASSNCLWPTCMSKLSIALFCKQLTL